MCSVYVYFHFFLTNIWAHDERSTCWMCNDKGARGLFSMAHDNFPKCQKFYSTLFECACDACVIVRHFIANWIEDLLILLLFHFTANRISNKYHRFFDSDFWYAFRIDIIVPYSLEVLLWDWESRSWTIGRFPCDTKNSMFIFMRRTNTLTHPYWIWFGDFHVAWRVSPTNLAHPFQFQLSSLRIRSMYVVKCCSWHFIRCVYLCEVVIFPDFIFEIWNRTEKPTCCNCVIKSRSKLYSGHVIRC